MNCWNLQGNDWVVDLLTKQATQDNIRHAYLFTGPSGIGRRTFAIRFMQALSCPEPVSIGCPCGQCRICRQIESMQYIDLSVVKRHTDRTRILIEQMRDLQNQLKLSPHENKYRFALCVNFDDANESAQNAFLKTLEEAPSRVILMLTAGTAETLLPTIVSRCEVIRLRPMGISDLEQELLAKGNIQPPDAKLIAHLSQGCPGSAQNLINQPETLEWHQKMTSESLRLIQQDVHERIQFARSMAEKKHLDDPLVLLKVWELLWTDILHRAADSHLSLINLTYSDQISSISGKITPDDAGSVLRLLRRSSGFLECNVNKSLLFENLLIHWPVIRPN